MHTSLIYLAQIVYRGSSSGRDSNSTEVPTSSSASGQRFSEVDMISGDDSIPGASDMGGGGGGSQRTGSQEMRSPMICSPFNSVSTRLREAQSFGI